MSFDSILQDLRGACRQLWRKPGLTVVSLLVFGLSVTACLTLFGLLEAIAFRKLPVAHPDELVAIGGVIPDRELEGNRLSAAVLPDLEALGDVFKGVTGYISSGITALDRGGPTQVGLDAVAGNYFTVMGLNPAAGRLLTTDDVRTGANVAVISYDYWQTRWNADRAVIGREIRLGGMAFEVVGVVRARYRGVNAGSPADITVPVTRISQVYGLPQDYPLPLAHAIGRLRPGVSLGYAKSRVAAVWHEILKGLTAPTAEETAQLLKLRAEVTSASTGFSHLRAWYQAPLYLLMFSSAWLLLIACVNLAGLTVARHRDRAHEMSVRSALGASRLRLLRQLLTEDVLVSVLGTLISIPLAFVVAGRLLLMMWGQPEHLPFDLRPGAGVMMSIVAAALGTGIVVGWIPAWLASRPSLAQSTPAARIVPGARFKWNEALLVAQVALAIVLLVGAGLLTRNLWELRGTQPGFQIAGVFLTQLEAHPNGYQNLDVFAYCRRLVDELEQQGGVRSVALSDVEPVMGLQAGEVKRQVGRSSDPAVTVAATVVAVSPRYFETMGVPLRGGRDIGWADDGQREPVAIVSAGLASQLFADGRAVGERIRIGTGRRSQNVSVVGVVADARLADLHSREPRFVFVPLLQEANATVRSPSILVRSDMPLADIEAGVRGVVDALGQDYVVRVRTLAAQVDQSLLRERLLVIGAMYFGALAAAIVATGLVGILSNAVTRRTREIAVRGAIGASPATLRSMILRQSLRVALTGLAIGLPSAWIVGRFVRGTVVDLGTLDPLIFTAATVLTLAVALGAAWVPAQRAARIRPADALKAE